MSVIYAPCSEDCLFYGTSSCTSCDVCTYCGKYLYWSGKRKNIHVDHILAWSSYGRAKVPACKDCNLSKGRKGLKEWLRWLRAYRPEKWKQIVENNKWEKHKIAQAVREVRDEYY